MIPATHFRAGLDYDLELEAKVLGVCIAEPHAFGSILPILIIESFYLTDHQFIFQVIKEMHADGLPIDELLVTRYCHKKGRMYMDNKDNTAYFIGCLVYGVCSSAHLEVWAFELREMSAQREMIALQTGGYSGEDVFDSAEKINQRLKRILDVKAVDDWKTIQEVQAKMEMEIKERAENPNSLFTTTISLLDNLNGGFRAGNLIVLGARPSVGKSAFLGRLATRNAANGKRVGIISLEMENTSIYTRLVAFESDVNFAHIDRDTLEVSQRQHVYNTMKNMSKMPIYFSDTASVNSQDIRSKVEKLRKKHGCDILFIDYLQLIETPNDKGKSREQEVAKISRDMKALAKTMQIPIVLLAQVNRSVMDKGDMKPQLHHLRESGSIEADADIVMFLHRDWLVGKTTDAEGHTTEKEAHLLVRKWRNGAIPEIKIGFEPTTMKFHELEGELVKYITPQPEPDNPYSGFQKPNDKFKQEDFNNF